MRSTTVRCIAVVLPVVAVLNVGCSSVPSSGHVTAVGPAPSAGAPARGANVQIGVSGTKYDPSADPMKVVSGFLDAEVDTTNDGKQNVDAYLTPATSWDRDSGAIVYSTRTLELVPPLAGSAKREVRVTYQLLARIDTNGEYLPEGGRVTQSFKLAVLGGGWHIAELPSGRHIDSSSLDQVFRRVTPYFYSPDVEADVLIPDPVYVLVDPRPVVNSLVLRLLAGPTPALRTALEQASPAGSLAWGFPTGTTLLSAAVDANIAEITFSEELDQLPQAKRGRLVAQLVWTLTSQDLQIDAVRVKVHDRPFQFDATVRPDEQSQAQWSRYDPDARLSKRPSYFNLDGRLEAYQPSQSVPPRSGRLLGDPTAQPSVDTPETRVAIVAPVPRKPLLELRVGPTGAGKMVAQLSADRLTEPSWGTESDGVWVVSQQGDDVPQVFTAQGATKENKRIAADDLSTRVDAFQVAPDGMRVAAVIERGGERRVEIGYITRGVFSGAALHVGGWRAVTTGIDVSSVAWAGSGKLAIIGKQGTEAPAVYTVLVDGSAVRQSSGSADIIASGESAHLVALPVQHDDAKRGDIAGDGLMLVVSRRVGATVAGEIYVNRGAGWSLGPRAG